MTQTKQKKVKDGWWQNKNGNWLYFCEGTLEGTVFIRDDGTWCGVNEGAFLPDTYEDVDKAKEAYEELFG